MPTTDYSPTLQLACDLIERASVTPEDAGCQRIIRQRLEAIGFDCHTLIFGEGKEAVENLWAIRHGKNRDKIFCFAGHTDVVPTGPSNEWETPPFQASIKGDFLHGRGTADMKGSLAAMITATEDFIHSNPKHSASIAYLITADEEGPARNGTVKVVEWLEDRGIKLTWCLVGEPSSTERVGDIIKNGRRGSLGGRLKVLGRQGHVAYPHLAENPIHKIAPALAELASEVWDEGNDFFPATSFQVSNMNAGTGATNVIPGIVDVIFNFRFSTEQTPEALQQRTQAILDKYDFNYELNWQLSGLPFLTAKGELVEAAVNAIEMISGQNPELSTAGGTSDGRFIAPTGAQVLELGPVNTTIHQVNECVNIRDLEKLQQMYCQILQQLTE